MSKLFYLFLEPLEERYTEQWMRWLKKDFGKCFEVEMVEGERLTNSIEDGSFLDVYSSMHWYFEQLKKVVKFAKEKRINKDDVIFVADMEMWGLEALGYLKKLGKLDAKIYAFLHAGSYTDYDLMKKAESIGRWQEKAWAESVDGIFVGSEYHKRKVVEKRQIDEKKIYVVGNPFYKEYDFDVKKRKQIYFPHRFDIGKGILQAIPILLSLKKEGWEIKLSTPRKRIVSDTKFVEKFLREYKEEFNIEVGISKEQYYRNLAESEFTLSTTLEENFGYVQLEAMAMGSKPIAPKKYAIPEVVWEKGLLYEKEDEVFGIVKKYEGEIIDFKENVEYFSKSGERMCKVMMGENK